LLKAVLNPRRGMVYRARKLGGWREAAFGGSRCPPGTGCRR